METLSDHGVGLLPVSVAPAQSILVYKNKIMICLPWLKQISPITSFCVSQLIDRRRTHTMVNFGDAFVAHSRNTCADVFLQSDLEWQLTIDDDMVLPFGNAEWFRAYTGWSWFPEPFASLNALDRLLSHKKTLVGALYFGRYPKGPPVFCEGASNAKEGDFARQTPMDVLKPTRWVGTGCLLIHRSVYEDIEKLYPRLSRGPNKKGGNWFSPSEHKSMGRLMQLRELLTSGPLDGPKAYQSLEIVEVALAEAKRNSGLGTGEDVTFCIRAKEAGHQPYVDLGLVAGHIGHCVYGPRNTFRET